MTTKIFKDAHTLLIPLDEKQQKKQIMINSDECIKIHSHHFFFSSPDIAMSNAYKYSDINPLSETNK
jgi:hypothetical protein